MNPAPCVPGWSVFGTAHEDHMMDVKEHADILANNIQAGASEGTQTDVSSSEEFNSVPVRPMRPVNFSGPLPQQ